MAVYFTADTHLGHVNIIKYCSRPFADILSMNEAIFDFWNQTVKPEDTVYHLGDVVFKEKEDLIKKIKKLPGKKFLIPGNHDSNFSLLSEAFTIKESLTEISINKVKFILCHYPLLTWNAFFYGSMHFFGHVHGKIPPTNQRIDVGVDSWGFAPVRCEVLLSAAQNFPKHLNPEIGSS
ncbi:MAG: metallophosphoesterase [Desulfovibrionaceae bacterium]|nr:metallophosphoesterase [Desulfovibrionaceae bacterium]